MIKQMKVADITSEECLQMRVEMNEDAIAEYAHSMCGGTEFPPIIVVGDGENYWLADGYHRVAAARRAEIESLKADVRTGSKRDAILVAIEANNQHGVRSTFEDRRKACIALLKDEEWSQWSNREIARRCGIAESSVRNIKKEEDVWDTAHRAHHSTVKFVHPKTGKETEMRTDKHRRPKETPAPVRYEPDPFGPSEVVDAEDGDEAHTLAPVNQEAPATVLEIPKSPADLIALLVEELGIDYVKELTFKGADYLHAKGIFGECFNVPIVPRTIREVMAGDVDIGEGGFGERARNAAVYHIANLPAIDSQFPEHEKMIMDALAIRRKEFEKQERRNARRKKKEGKQ
jgi:hypothetical protein